MSKNQIKINEAFQLHQSGNFSKAIKIYKNILIKEQRNADLLFLLGTAYGQIGENQRAIDILLRSLELQPNNIFALDNLANAYRAINRFDKAVECCDQAIKVNSDFPQVYWNRGIALQEQNKIEEAIRSYSRAVDLRPDFIEAFWNLSHALLVAGEYIEGWKLYEWRLKKCDMSHNYCFYSKINWRGDENIFGKKILISSEQGLGDTLQFCRYITKLQSLGADIIFEVPERLIKILSTLDANVIFVNKGDQLPEFDAYCPLMSLPYVFKTKVETIPAEVPYLYSDPSKVSYYQKKLGEKKKLRIGLVWSGSKDYKNNQRRSMHIQTLLPLTINEIEWHSLQIEYAPGELEILNKNRQIFLHDSDQDDFSDTAALIECMDLIISVCTSCAHLAGSLGKDVWILLPYSPDFRWFLDREDSPWYPTARLFRQPKRDDWTSVIERVKNELMQLI